MIAIDSSGSINEIVLNSFLSEVNFIMSLITNYKIDLIVCDDTIRSHKTFSSGESLEIDIVGGMGTDFRPVFQFIEDYLYDTNLLLYFTDLDGIFPKEEPLYDLKWVVSKEGEIPFGEMIVLES